MEPKRETLLEKFEAFQQFFIFPAMTVLPVMRRRVGLRSLKGFYFWLPLAIMGFVGVQFSQSHALTYFAVFVAIVTLWQRRNRWQEIRSGQLWHTRSLGVSVWEFLPDFTPQAPPPETMNNGEAPQAPSPLLQISPFFQTDRRLYRWVDPLCLFIVGLIVHRFDAVFGAWLMFAALSLRIIEEYAWEKSIESMLDQYDGLITAEQQNEALQELRRGQPTVGTDGATLPRPAPPPKGVAEDLREQVAARRAEAEAREELRRREAMAAAETAAKNAQASAERAQEAAERAEEEGPTHSHTHTQETVIKETVIISNTERERVWQQIILPSQTEPMQVLIVHHAGGGRQVIGGTIPDDVTEEAWLKVHTLYNAMTFLPETEAEILEAYDQRQLTGDTTPIQVNYWKAPEPPAPEDEESEATA